MALTLTKGVELVADQMLQYRVALGFYYVARSILVEDENIVGHEQRERFARATLVQPHDQFLQYAAMVITDPTIVSAGPATAAAITDGQIIAAITAMWNPLANVPPA